MYVFQTLLIRSRSRKPETTEVRYWAVDLVGHFRPWVVSRRRAALTSLVGRNRRDQFGYSWSATVCHLSGRGRLWHTVLGRVWEGRPNCWYVGGGNLKSAQKIFTCFSCGPRDLLQSVQSGCGANQLSVWWVSAIERLGSEPDPHFWCRV